MHCAMLHISQMNLGIFWLNWVPLIEQFTEKSSSFNLVRLLPQRLIKPACSKYRIIPNPKFNIHRLPAPPYNTGWIDHHPVCYGHFNAKLILDPLDIEKALLLYILCWLSTITHLSRWISLCELYLGRKLNTNKSKTSPWRLCARRGPEIILKLLQWWEYIAFWCTFFILLAFCNRVGSWTTDSILLLKTRPLILPISKRCFWSMWRINTVRNIAICHHWTQKRTKQ